MTAGGADTSPYRLKQRRLYAAVLESPEIKALPPHVYNLILAVAKMAEDRRVDAMKKDAELDELRNQVTRLTTANEQLSRSMTRILEVKYGKKEG